MPVEPRRVGRYVVHRELAAGAVGVVSLAKRDGDGRVVAVKRLHAKHARDAQLVATLFDEARIVGLVRHPNVVSVLEVVESDGEVLLAMDYVEGESLSGLLAASAERGEPVPPSVAVTVALECLDGLHAAHEAADANGLPLGIVHRDVSPQNVLVDAHGVARVTDFGIAKAVGRMQITTQHGVIKGKLRYMSPEQFSGEGVDRRADLWSVGVILWEMLAGIPLFEDANAAMIFFGGSDAVPAPSVHRTIPPELERVVLRAVARDPRDRFSTAAEMAAALTSAHPRATPAEIAAWVLRLAGTALEDRAASIRELDAPAEPPPPRTPPAPPAPRSPRLLRGVLALTAATGAAVLVATWGRNAGSDAGSPPPSAPVPSAATIASASVVPVAPPSSSEATPTAVSSPKRSASPPRRPPLPPPRDADVGGPSRPPDDPELNRRN